MCESLPYWVSVLVLDREHDANRIRVGITARACSEGDCFGQDMQSLLEQPTTFKLDKHLECFLL